MDDKYDLKTLQMLYEEAMSYYDDADEEFQKTDCHEARHDRNKWQEVGDWLAIKLND